MPPASGKKADRIPPNPLAEKEKPSVIKLSPFEPTPRNFRIGGNIRPRLNLSRYVRWPRYIKIQRQRKILLQRLKIPPAINQFKYTLDKSQTIELLRFLENYKPETKKEKKARLTSAAESLATGGAIAAPKRPFVLKSGVNHVTDLIEYKKAKLIVLAHDVHPIELVICIPALCRRKGIPYCIVKSKSRLGKLINQKTATVLALDNIRKQDQAKFDHFVKLFTVMFNDNVDVRRQWGGNTMGIKSQHKQLKKDLLIAQEQSKKLGY